ncbi:Cytochrome P450 [Lentzea albidocapillata subsp. violacea]|uniref:Cytochrome P450 n=1 Tax=Lentzea albidocapillata subsp. violacea TaxID=128104 RepID=A0A1G8QJE2_9PSEU|nr:cytochrome P450 [Lentzea albidocapillata]SDJ04852.1 Cytochrome P450 [Lentzea albidocapillata subsp. violacea]
MWEVLQSATDVRSRVTEWMGKRFLAHLSKTGFDLESSWFVPSKVLAPLRRNGLDPVPELARMQAHGPVTRLPLPVTVWLVTGYEASKQVLVDSEAFSNDFGHLRELGLFSDEAPGGLGFSDPPEHTRLRKVLTPEFTMRRLSRLVPRIEAIVADQLDLMSMKDGPVDLVEHFAMTVPALTICELLGVPASEREEFQRRSVSRFDLGGAATTSLSAVSESIVYFRELVRSQRLAPTDGLLGELVRKHGDDLGDDELAGLADGLLTGGFETTASMISLGTLALLRDPGLREQALGDDKAVNGLVDELLRHLSVVSVAFLRIARHDIEVAGTKIKAGDIVACSLSQANRDPSAYPSPDVIVPERAAGQHLAFGYGAHRCIGAELAKIELRIAYPALVKRFPEMRLAVAPGDLSFRKLSIVYGLHSMPMHLGRQPSPIQQVL